MSAPLLEAVDLQCERDDRLLFHGLCVSIVPGTLTRVEGPNGAGKTTLLRILAGLYQGFDGTVLWRGAAREHQREEFLRNLLFLGHRPGVKPRLTPLENLQAAMAFRQSLGRPVLMDALADAGLAGFESVPCQQLSAGQQRRVGLARLLLSDEPLWILDEAFTAIDQEGVQGLESLLSGRVAAGGAVVLTTHHRLAIEGMQRLVLGDGAAGAESSGAGASA